MHRLEANEAQPWQPEGLPSSQQGHIQCTLHKKKSLPPITWGNFYRGINMISTLALTIVPIRLTPILAIYGAFTTPLYCSTLAWSILYYYFTGLGITSSYHCLWAH
ncbi:hypothetical protein PGTUg99_012419 [Puccinia graminis f. sp. tritici]|uniref:Uncharacterized protein n=1 Tax=Puccinia graminis f. sp. tritici TaxID=56615 RepID=A0A5B0RNQ7_PUCGR|nr:hypothetical protein PGTUg99_012419 [Puccinia graminis f. sp. tritici]